MARDASIQFAEFRLEPDNARLWHGTQTVKLKPKAFAVLHCLVEHAGQLVTKDDLWQAIWPDVTVSDDVLAASIRDIRKAVGDNAKTPRFIETVHRRGYRFIAPLRPTPPVSSSKFQVSSLETQSSVLGTHHSVLVGREFELTQLHGYLEKALNGERQIVFVTGEPGIGKTALLEAFMFGVRSYEAFGVHSPQPRTPNPELAPTSEVWWGWGQCIEQFGEGEAYLPILTALGQLGRSAVGPHMIEVLKQYAPSWLVQLPALVPPGEFDVLRHRTTGTTRPRMLRELAEALEALTAVGATGRSPLLILVLEDLHWSDPSTLEWLSFVAKRRAPARLMILSSYRPVEMLAAEHPLRAVLRELRLHQQCQELSLPLLTASEITTYLTQRVREEPNGTDGEAGQKSATDARDADSFREVAGLIYQRTEGNPLFMVSLINELETRGLFGAQPDNSIWHEQATVLTRDVPNNIRQFVTDQSDRLRPTEQRLLEAASLAGMTFSTASVAAALEAGIVETEEGCARLATQQRFLRPAGIVKWPDGIVAAGYGFLHALYQQLWHERVAVSKLQQFHLRIGNRKEHAYGDRAGEIAAELAVHFEQGRDYRRAVQYLGQAGQNAIRRNAPHEAIMLLSKGLELLNILPDLPERLQQELRLQIGLGGPLMATKGFAAPEVENTYTRALELCQQVGDAPQLFPIQWNLWLFAMMRGELQTARGLGEQLLALAQSTKDVDLVLQAHHALGATLSWLGELSLTRTHLEQGVALYEPQRHSAHAFLYGGHDPGTCCQAILSRMLWLLGYPDQALKKFSEALALAHEVAHSFSLANALYLVARVHQFRREAQATQEYAETLVELCRERGFAQFLASGTILRGWALAEQGQETEGIDQIRQGVTAYQITGAVRSGPHDLALLAETYGKVEQPEEGLRALSEALTLVDTTGERYYEAELYRLYGELLLAQEGKEESQKSKVKAQKSKIPNPQLLTPNPQTEAEAETCFLKAIDVARQQSAKSWELRATMSLARLWQQRGKQAEARHLLGDVYNWFTEGFDTADLKDAKALLKELA